MPHDAGAGEHRPNAANANAWVPRFMGGILPPGRGFGGSADWAAGPHRRSACVSVFDRNTATRYGLQASSVRQHRRLAASRNSALIISALKRISRSACHNITQVEWVAAFSYYGCWNIRTRQTRSAFRLRNVPYRALLRGARWEQQTLQLGTSIRCVSAIVPEQA